MVVLRFGVGCLIQGGPPTSYIWSYGDPINGRK